MTESNSKSGRTTRRFKIPRKVSTASIESAALYYLGRYASSSENLRKVLERKIIRASKYHNTDVKACIQLVEDLIQRYLKNGILNDEAYAQTQAASMGRRGKSLRTIRFRLLQKSLPKKIIDKTIEALENEIGSPDLPAAIAYARKRRFGPYRRDVNNLENLEKELAALARSGFSYSIALSIVKAKNIDELEANLKNLGNTVP